MWLIPSLLCVLQESWGTRKHNSQPAKVDAPPSFHFLPFSFKYSQSSGIKQSKEPCAVSVKLRLSPSPFPTKMPSSSIPPPPPTFHTRSASLTEQAPSQPSSKGERPGGGEGLGRIVGFWGRCMNVLFVAIESEVVRVMLGRGRGGGPSGIVVERRCESNSILPPTYS